MAYFLFTKAILNNQPIDIFNNGKMFSFFYTWCCDPDIFTSCFNHLDGLSNCCFGIHGIGGGHGLDTDGIITSQRGVTNIHNTGFIIEHYHRWQNYDNQIEYIKVAISQSCKENLEFIINISQRLQQ